MSAPSNSKSKLSSKESSSVQSTSSLLTTTSSECKDPVEFVRKRGYEVTGTIGEGSFAKVYRARVKGKETQGHAPTYLMMAIKVFDLSNAEQRLWVEKCLKNEMFISKNVKHPNVIMTCDVMKTPNHGYIIMRLAANGSIKDELCHRLKRPYSDAQAKEYFKGLNSGLQYLHSQNIVHRDLKLENFLLSAKNVPMLADFGFAARAKVPSNVVLTQMLKQTICGTKGYMAPELFPKVKAAAFKGERGGSSTSVSMGGCYDAKAIDVYAMGASLFEMFNLTKPFGEETTVETMSKIATHQVHYHNTKVENACKELISIMLRLEPNERPKVEEVLKHRWVEHGVVVNAIFAALHI